MLGRTKVIFLVTTPLTRALLLLDFRPFASHRPDGAPDEESQQADDDDSGNQVGHQLRTCDQDDHNREPNPPENRTERFRFHRCFFSCLSGMKLTNIGEKISQDRTIPRNSLVSNTITLKGPSVFGTQITLRHELSSKNLYLLCQNNTLT